jgi:dihydrofolate reductase
VGPLEWPNSTVLRGDAVAAVLAVKQADGGDLQVIGSPQPVQTLVEHDLVDEYRLMIDPLIVGGGKRLFCDGTAPKPLRLVESEATSTGAILAQYTTSEG